MENKLSAEEMKTALEQMGSLAKEASRKLAVATTDEKNRWLNWYHCTIISAACHLFSAGAPGGICLA